MSEPLAKRYPAVYVLAAMAVGIILGDCLEMKVWSWLGLGAAFFVAAAILFMKSKPTLAAISGLVCIAALMSFNFAFQFKTFPPGHAAEYADDERNHIIYGVVDDWPELDERSVELAIRVDSIETAGETRKGQGKILLRINVPTSRLQYGDAVFFESRIYSIKGGDNFSGFNYRRHMNLKGIYGACYLPHQYSIHINSLGRGHIYSMITALRNMILETFRGALEPDCAALAGGFLIGETRGISPEIYNYFRDSGVLHVLAVSGSNVAFVLLLLSFMLKGSRLGPAGRSGILIGALIVFSFLAYNQPSVTRASTMAALIILGRAFQRRIDYNNIIASSAIIILAFSPTQMYDVGFQLSYATAWGLIYFLPIAEKIFGNIRSKFYYKYLLWPLLISLIAQISSAPISAYYFQRLPLISIFSNLIIAPLVGLIVIGEMGLLIVSLIIPLGAQFIGGLLNPVIRFVIFLSELFGSVPVSALSREQFSGLTIILIYVLLIVFGAAVFSKFARRAAAMATLVAGTLLAFPSPFGGRNGERFLIFSGSGGILAVHVSESPQIIMSSLSPRDYCYSDKLIAPLFGDRKLPPADVIALSTDWQTLKETVILARRKISSKSYIPQSARGLFLEACREMEWPCESSKTVYFKETIGEMEENGRGIYVRRGEAIYMYDSASLVFRDASFLDENWRLIPSPSMREVGLIKPKLTLADTALTKGQSALKFIVCEKADRDFLSWAEKENLRPGTNAPKLAILSEVGAAEIVIRNGRLEFQK
jgi:ComEC/Rec2-related protein